MECDVAQFLMNFRKIHLFALKINLMKAKQLEYFDNVGKRLNQMMGIGWQSACTKIKLDMWQFEHERAQPNAFMR